MRNLDQPITELTVGDLMKAMTEVVHQVTDKRFDAMEQRLIRLENYIEDTRPFMRLMTDVISRHEDELTKLMS